MAATISFLAGEGSSFTDVGTGNGLGFYGPGGFGTSIRVGQYNDNTYATDPTGTTNGPKVNNVKWVHPLTGQLPTGDMHVLQDIPNALAPLNIRFTNDNPVQTTNATVTIFDRSNTNNPPVGVTCKVAEVIHPWATMLPSGPLGSGDTQWSQPGGSGGVINGVAYDPPLALADSPGSGGWSPSGSSTTDTIHDWFCLISASPDSVGSKQAFSLYFSVEYL